MSTTSASRRLRELALWVGAVAGLVAVAAGVAVVLGGVSFLVFRSGSMAPEIETGAVALSRTVDAADIAPGDVVSVVAANGERVTHRVVSSTLHGDTASLVLQGDANEAADSEIYVVTSAERVVASVPYGGYVMAHVLTPPGLVALGSLSVMLIVLTGGGDRPAGAARLDPKHRGRVSARRRTAAGAALLAVVAGSGATLAHTTGTWATYTDRARAGTGTFGAATVAPAASITCDVSTIRWTAPSNGTPSGYRMTWSYSGGSGTTDFGAGVLAGRPPAPGLFGNRAYTVTVSALYGTWVSVPTASDTIRAQNLALGTSWTC